MSVVNFNYQLSIKDLLTKIDAISTQMIKIKRIDNKNKLILKNLDKQTEYMFETIPQL